MKPKQWEHLSLTYAGGISVRKGTGKAAWVLSTVEEGVGTIWATDAFGNKTEIRQDRSFKVHQNVLETAIGTHQLRSELLARNYKELK